jgi:hypothetical protein
MVNEPLLTVLYDGEPMLEVYENGSYGLVSAGVNKARIAGGNLDVVNKLGSILVDLRQQAKCGMINPYRDAILMDADKVMQEISRRDRGGMRVKDVGAVMNALLTIAKRGTQ